VDENRTFLGSPKNRGLGQIFGGDAGERRPNEKSGDRREKTLSWLCIQAFPDHRRAECDEEENYQMPPA
jgi:hypothetical protein